MRHRGAKQASFVFLALVLALPIFLPSVASAQGLRCPTSSAAGEPTDPERIRDSGGGFKDESNSANPLIGSDQGDGSSSAGAARMNSRGSGLHQVGGPASLPSRSPVASWVESVWNVLRRFGIILPKGHRP